MNWNLRTNEARLRRYLDGLLHPTEQAASTSCEHVFTLYSAGWPVFSPCTRPLHTLAQVVTAAATFRFGSRRDDGAPRAGRRAIALAAGLPSPRFVVYARFPGRDLSYSLRPSGFSFSSQKLADLHPARIYPNADIQAHRFIPKRKFRQRPGAWVLKCKRAYKTGHTPTPGATIFPQIPPNNSLAAPTTQIRPSAPKQQNPCR